MLCHMIPSQPVSALRNKQINNKNQNKINYKDIPVEGTYQLQRYTSRRDISITKIYQWKGHINYKDIPVEGTYQFVITISLCLTS